MYILDDYEFNYHITVLVKIYIYFSIKCLGSTFIMKNVLQSVDINIAFYDEFHRFISKFDFQGNKESVKETF